MNGKLPSLLTKGPGRTASLPKKFYALWQARLSAQLCVSLVALLAMAGCTYNNTEKKRDASRILAGELTPERRLMYRNIHHEPLGDYYIARRYYKYRVGIWGYLRRPRQFWGGARLIMLNEDVKLAPDRALGKLGIDDNYEYKFYGHYSTDRVYEPASNSFYPEFILQDYELIDKKPPSIFGNDFVNNKHENILYRPELVDLPLADE